MSNHLRDCARNLENYSRFRIQFPRRIGLISILVWWSVRQCASGYQCNHILSNILRLNCYFASQKRCWLPKKYTVQPSAYCRFRTNRLRIVSDSCSNSLRYKEYLNLFSFVTIVIRTKYRFHRTSQHFVLFFCNRYTNCGDNFIFHLVHYVLIYRIPPIYE